MMPEVGVRAVLGKMPWISEALPKRVLALGKTGAKSRLLPKQGRGARYALPKQGRGARYALPKQGRT